MALKKALYYGAIAIAILIAVTVVVSVLTTILSLAWAIVSAAVSLAVLLGLVYVAYRVGKWLFGGSDRGGRTTDGIGTSGSSTTSEPADPQERLRMQYVEGQISEAEFERRIERELETESVEDELDRELNRER
ncbi:hypothetical protein GRS48_14590 [Halorubrum sp. JWXQ-INN 858]|uniref:hypothetical protein n=1 Tax=Halorubrum sp. JWXQ-INN 858 TaxID=2690782 RepID=UPI00135700FC|nr:hypothetical protein [Halorubrum sp. JWXQ-INN 858]MWV66037.1 hypothetical protein [Halorubrum sp. JWXQ-INN 858]